MRGKKLTWAVLLGAAIVITALYHARNALATAAGGFTGTTLALGRFVGEQPAAAAQRSACDKNRTARTAARIRLISGRTTGVGADRASQQLGGQRQQRGQRVRFV